MKANLETTKFEQLMEIVDQSKDFRTKERKIPILTLISIGIAIFYIIYDTPKIIINFSTHNQKNMISMIQYQLLYTVTHLIPIFASPFYGIFTDLYSVRNTYLLNFSVCLLGYTIFFIGCIEKSFLIILIGRLLISFGFPVSSTSFAYLSKWFNKSNDVWAFSFLSFAARIGGFIVSFLLSSGENKTNFMFPLIFPMILIILFFIGVFKLYHYDYLIDEELNKEKSSIVLPKTNFDPLYSSLDSHQKEKIGQFFLVFNLRNFRVFERSYWMLVFASGVIFMTIFTFYNRLNELLISKYLFSSEKARFVHGVCYLFTAITSIFYGYLVSIFEKRLKFLTISAVFNVTAHLIFYLSSSINLCYLGLFLKCLVFASLPVAHYSCFVLIVPSNRIGRAYGFNQMIEYILVSLGFLISTLMVNNENNGFDKFEKFELFTAAISVISLCIFLRLIRLKI